MKKTIILCHSDCDGLTAGAIALAANEGARIWLTNPINLHRALEGLEDHTRVIITDIALNEGTYKETFKKMKELVKEGVEIIYIDHHPLPEKVKQKDIPASTVIHKTKGCSAELTYLHFEKHLGWHHKFLAAVGAVGDYEIDSLFAQEVMRDFDGRSISFQAAIIVQALGEIPTENDIQMKKSMIERMSMGVLPSELTDLVEKAIIGSRVEAHVRNYVHDNVESKKQIGYILDIPTGGGFKGKGALFAATAADKPVGICGNSIHDKISISIRRRNAKVDLNKAARNAGKAVGGSGGGHVSAAGATIERDQWNKFLDLMDFEVQKQLS